MTPDERRAEKKLIGEVLIPETREAQNPPPPMDDTLPVALELAFTALAMKPSVQHPAMFIARRYASLMGLDPDQVEEFARHRIAEELNR